MTHHQQSINQSITQSPKNKNKNLEPDSDSWHEMTKRCWQSICTHFIFQHIPQVWEHIPRLRLQMDRSLQHSVESRLWSCWDSSCQETSRIRSTELSGGCCFVLFCFLYFHLRGLMMPWSRRVRIWVQSCKWNERRETETERERDLLQLWENSQNSKPWLVSVTFFASADSMLPDLPRLLLRPELGIYVASSSFLTTASKGAQPIKLASTVR